MDDATLAIAAGTNISDRGKASKVEALVTDDTSPVAKASTDLSDADVNGVMVDMNTLLFESSINTLAMAGAGRADSTPLKTATWTKKDWLMYPIVFASIDSELL
ncbi:hypothetical protein [Leptothoe sp. PORK10 BA2]|uniref:hypothetical protein n=1 Tax=Leptothoe sp. PORK10 BA2 TaxID=3110254 RepID=UPI002B1F180E|nr:hypothetical protein [Leptothoe sp. PORK10 BA2]MEA5462196.1 hypothetical protein [Leptothoe sp. PORK10 BA2]